MLPNCPDCEKKRDFISDDRTIVRFGSYYRTSDSKSIKRYRCLRCRRTYSKASNDVCFRQKKRQINNRLRELLASGVSQRRAARLIRINRHTVARRLKFFGSIFREQLLIENAFLRVHHLQFDDLETFEHTKCKPLSITLALDGETRRIL